MTSAISERVVVRARRAGVPDRELQGERFMGAMLHPVSIWEMVQQCHVRHPGRRLRVYWPPRSDDAHPIMPGDAVDVAGHDYKVAGVQEHPPCYLDVYLEKE